VTEEPNLPHQWCPSSISSSSFSSSFSRSYRKSRTVPSQMAGGGGKLVVMVAEKPSICNSIAHTLCGGSELSTRGTSRGDWGRGGFLP